ncbi:MAG: HAD-IA family hydrolase [Lachnospiraceae bacterium]|nr:HAD-IA family hydrolase [Lachnospiraceae bacterium]
MRNRWFCREGAAVLAGNYQYLLVDLDDTILDWKMSERTVLCDVIFRRYGRTLTEEEIARYGDINAACWKQLERREITKEELTIKRFQAFLESLSIAEDEEGLRALNRSYMERNSQLAFVIPGAERACRELAKRYRLILITNGTDWVQRGRLAKIPFAECFCGVVISDEVGCNKPAPEFFRGVTAITGDTDVSRYLVIGDSQSSDIAFGRAIGADTCWVRTRGDGQSGESTYTVSSLAEAATLLL